MTARVLIVDDVPANLRLLEAKLMAEYFGVTKATSGQEAIDLATAEQPDIILLDVMMPDMDGYETCRRLKAAPETEHIPIIMVTALDQPSNRIEGLEAGADDFLTKPLNDVALFARVKSLVRLKMVTDELRMREATGERIGALDSLDASGELLAEPGHVLIIEDRRTALAQIQDTLSAEHRTMATCEQGEFLALAAEENFDAIIVSLSLKEADGLRLCSELRSAEHTRQTPIVVLVEEGETDRLVRALEMGVNDYIMRPIDRNELIARLRTQLRRKRYQDCLRDKFQQGLELAVKDGLTGLYNRRYMTSHVNTLVADVASTGKLVSLLMFDIDFFKAINDTHGHAAGDEVLKDFSRRLEDNVRGVDMTCRLGGEEFVVVMPDTDLAYAYMIAERLRQIIADRPFAVTEDVQISVTVSIGVAVLEGLGDTAEALLDRADQALYRAKRDGRNRVVAEAA